MLFFAEVRVPLNPTSLNIKVKTSKGIVYIEHILYLLSSLHTDIQSTVYWQSF